MIHLITFIVQGNKGKLVPPSFSNYLELLGEKNTF